jgi:hypothetical protein
MEINFHDGIFATSYGLGPFHPAIRNGKRVYYWPNITFASEDQAYERACLTLADALQPTADIVRDWNVYKVE